jgi:hypothetical protein
MEPKYRQVVEGAGGHYLGIKGGVVYFALEPGQKTVALYCFACTLENVRLSLKAHSENLAADLWASLI